MTTPEDAAKNTDVSQEQAEELNTGINQEHAEELARADYQARLEEFDNVETTPVVSVPAPGESGAVEMPKP